MVIHGLEATSYSNISLRQRFSISAHQFGTNYYENGRRYYPDDTMISPEEAASEYKDEHSLSTPELVLKGTYICNCFCPSLCIVLK